MSVSGARSSSAVAPQLDDDRIAPRPTPVQRGERFRGIAQLGVIEDDTRRVVPAGGRARGRGDDDPPPEAAGDVGVRELGHRGIMPRR